MYRIHERVFVIGALSFWGRSDLHAGGVPGPEIFGPEAAAGGADKDGEGGEAHAVPALPPRRADSDHLLPQGEKKSWRLVQLGFAKRLHVRSCLGRGCLGRNCFVCSCFHFRPNSSRGSCVRGAVCTT